MEEHWTGSQEIEIVALDPFIHSVLFTEICLVPARCQVLGFRNVAEKVCSQATYKVAQMLTSRWPFWASVSPSAK